MKQANAVRIFLSFAAAYFMSYSLRSVNAALAPLLASDLNLSAAQLGWLSSAYFLSFAALQLPLGVWLDRFGARLTESVLLLVAVLGAIILASSSSLLALSVGRILIGVGVAGNLMAPYAYFRRNFPASRQAQLAMWMLIAGTLGAIVATQPALQLGLWLGWRAVFWLAAGLLLLCALTIYVWGHEPTAPANSSSTKPQALSIMQVLVHPQMRRVIPTTIFFSGGFVAIQSLWAGPWLTIVLGKTPAQAGQILLYFNIGLLLSYVVMSIVSPQLEKRGMPLARQSIIAFAWFASAICILVLWRGEWSWIILMALTPCVPAVILMQTQTAMRFPVHMAGRALTSFNLVMFAAGFGLQWGIGLLVDLFQIFGSLERSAMIQSFACLGMLQVLTLIWFVTRPPVQHG